VPICRDGPMACRCYDVTLPGDGEMDPVVHLSGQTVRNFQPCGASRGRSSFIIVGFGGLSSRSATLWLFEILLISAISRVAIMEGNAGSSPIIAV